MAGLIISERRINDGGSSDIDMLIAEDSIVNASKANSNPGATNVPLNCIIFIVFSVIYTNDSSIMAANVA